MGVPARRGRAHLVALKSASALPINPEASPSDGSLAWHYA